MGSSSGNFGSFIQNYLKNVSSVSNVDVIVFRFAREMNGRILQCFGVVSYCKIVGIITSLNRREFVPAFEVMHGKGPRCDVATMTSPAVSSAALERWRLGDPANRSRIFSSLREPIWKGFWLWVFW